MKVIILPLLLACVESDPKIFLVTTGSGAGSAGIPPAQVDYPNRGHVDWKSRAEQIFSSYNQWFDVANSLNRACLTGELMGKYKKDASKLKKTLEVVVKKKITLNAEIVKTVMKKMCSKLKKTLEVVVKKKITLNAEIVK